ncbi:hypothetical protein [Amycolatopsis kentuckyensis]|uniref:hypothetical protein n=1 Tax=Amycolatopsis kentuckyensis TaxID=218823 RepID=UPI000A37B9E6|nr:hypothetical protein [Amycolatopsis kentuckyensis]
MLSLREGTPPEVDDRVAIIQHPGGLDDRVVQYWTDTEAGSPVFDDRWKVVALHHRWVDSPERDGMAYRNQGRAIARVADRLDALGVDLRA